MTNDSICVLGAGIVGITTAYYLSKKGYNVTVVDKNKNVAEGCKPIIESPLPKSVSFYKKLFISLKI